MGLNESEPDSVRARGEPASERRSLWQKLQIKDGTKHVKARTLVVAGMVGAGRQGRVDVEDERAVGVGRCSWPSGPKSRPAAVRALIVAMKRVMTVERRSAGRRSREGQT